MSCCKLFPISKGSWRLADNFLLETNLNFKQFTLTRTSRTIHSSIQSQLLHSQNKSQSQPCYHKRIIMFNNHINFNGSFSFSSINSIGTGSSSNNLFVIFSRHKTGGRLPIPKVPLTKIMKHYDIHGTISDEDSAKQFVYALDTEERRRLLQELEQFRQLDQEGDKEGKHSSKPSREQLRQVAIHQMFPFIGFGFLDNLLMILFGEYIDVTLGAAFGISTMAAAALGNLLSDVGGIGSASYVENLVTRLGVRAPYLTPEQVGMSSTRWASGLGKAFGVALGCLLGMFPLLFFKDAPKEKEKPKGDLVETTKLK